MRNRYHFRGSLSHHIDTHGFWVYLASCTSNYQPEQVSALSLHIFHFIMVYNYFDMWVKGSSLDIGRYHIAVPHFDIAVLMVPGYGSHHGVSNNMQDQFF